MMAPASWRILQQFLAVHDHQSFTRAASTLNVSQPAITRNMQLLEDRLKVRLFERSARGAIPTRYAEMLARRVRLMEIEYRYALDEIEIARRGSEARLRIGAGPAWYSRLLPPVVSDFLAKYPAVKISLGAGVPATLAKGLEAGEYDLVCTSLDLPNSGTLVKETLLTVRHTIIASRSHPLAGLDLVETDQLASYPWVVIEGDYIGTGRILSYFAGAGCEPPVIAIETSSLTTLQEFVARGPFLAHVADPILSAPLRGDITTLPIRGTFWESPAGMLYRQSEHRPQILRRFIDAVRSAVAER